MSDTMQPAPCTCHNCPGTSCTCGCRQTTPAAGAAQPACVCGEQCGCGQGCTCAKG